MPLSRGISAAPGAPYRPTNPPALSKAICRHIAQAKKHCEFGDPYCRQRKALLHWVYDSQKILKQGASLASACRLATYAGTS